MNDEQIPLWRDECRRLDIEIESLLWKIGRTLAEGVDSYGTPAKEFITTLRTPPNICTLAADVHRTTHRLRKAKEISFAIARELTVIKDEQTRFRFLEEAKEASDKHEDPKEFRKHIRDSLSNSCGSPNKPLQQPVKQARDLVGWLKNQPDEFWSPVICAAWLKEILPIVDFAKFLNEHGIKQAELKRDKTD